MTHGRHPRYDVIADPGKAGRCDPAVAASVASGSNHKVTVPTRTPVGSP
jgi:hypothetical protein